VAVISIQRGRSSDVSEIARQNILQQEQKERVAAMPRARVNRQLHAVSAG
jgi:hypothetical protein